MDICSSHPSSSSPSLFHRPRTCQAPGGFTGRKKEVVHCLRRVYKLPFWHRAGIRTLFSYMSELEEQAQVHAFGWLTGSKLTSTLPQLQLSLPSSLPLTLPGNILTATAQSQTHLGLFHVYCITQQPLETELETAGDKATHMSGVHPGTQGSWSRRRQSQRQD